MTMPDQVEVTQADRDAAADYLAACGWDWGACGDIREGRVDHPVVQAFARHRQAAIQKARADALGEAVQPWADFHGDLPDYDHPLRPVFESGIQYAVELLAKVLKVADYEVCDGTEEFDGDLGGTLFNIVTETWPKDEHGDWIDLRDPDTRASLTIRSLTESEVSREG